jgi:hypothetical protein
VVVHGHGLRARQVRGPPSSTTESCTIVVLVRRYECTRCDAVMTVVPRGLIRGRHYSASAIALAFALYGVLGLPIAETRRRVSAWGIVGSTACASWAQMRRWDRAVASGRLFARIRAAPAAWTMRQRAARAAMTLGAHAPAALDGAPVEARVFAGAALAR